MSNLQMAQKALTEACREMGLQDDVQIVELKGNRWILAYDQKPDFPRFDFAMIKLEDVLREVTRQEIDLMCETEADKNRRDLKAGRRLNAVSARGVESLDT